MEEGTVLVSSGLGKDTKTDLPHHDQVTNLSYHVSIITVSCCPFVVYDLIIIVMIQGCCQTTLTKKKLYAATASVIHANGVLRGVPLEEGGGKRTQLVLQQQDDHHPGGPSLQRITHQPPEMQSAAHSRGLSALHRRNVWNAGSDDAVLWYHKALPAQGRESSLCFFVLDTTTLSSTRVHCGRWCIWPSKSSPRPQKTPSWSRAAS